MSYTLVEVDELPQRVTPAADDKMLIKTAAGLDQYAVTSDVLGIAVYRDQQTFTGMTTPVLDLTQFTYDPAGDDIDVLFNGSLIYDYTKTNISTVTLGFSRIATDVVRVCKRWTP